MSAIVTSVHGADPISQAGVIATLRTRPEIRITTETNDPGDLSKVQVAVVIADHVDDATTQQLHRLRREGCRLVLVAVVIDDAALVAAAEAGVAGLLRRADASADALVRTITKVAAGEGQIPGDLMGRLLDQVGRLQRQVLAPRGMTFTGLSPRERQVLTMVADGHDTSEIATTLCYSERTVKNVLHDLTTRFQLRNRSHAVAYAVREGLI